MIFILKHDHDHLTLNVIRRALHIASAQGLEPFLDDPARSYFKGIIHPLSTRSVLNNLFVGEADIQMRQVDSTGKKITMEFANTKFAETVSIQHLMLFGRNSDVLDIRTMYLTEAGDIKL